MYYTRCMANNLNEARRSPKQRNMLSVDLGELKDPWTAWCVTQGVKPSTAIKEVVAKLTGGAGIPKPGRAVESQGTRDDQRVRREIKLTGSENSLAAKHAAAAGYSVPRWLLALVRAQLTGAAQFGQGEQELLGKSNYLLLTMGRNLNQIAKHLNTSPEDRGAYDVVAIEEARQAIDTHVKTVARLIESNVERWKLL